MQAEKNWQLELLWGKKIQFVNSVVDPKRMRKHTPSLITNPKGGNKWRHIYVCLRNTIYNENKNCLQNVYWLNNNKQPNMVDVKKIDRDVKAAKKKCYPDK